MAADGKLLVERLVHMIVRTFFSVECMVVVDALMDAGVVSDRDLAEQLNLQLKQVRSVLTTLVDAQVIKKDKKKNPKYVAPKVDPDAQATGAPPPPRPPRGEMGPTSDVFEVDYKLFVDSVKYRLALMRRKVNQEVQKENEDAFECPSCKQRVLWKQAVLNQDRQMRFLCDSCNVPLKSVESQFKTAVTKLQTLNDQLRPIDDLLKEIDSYVFVKEDKSFMTREEHKMRLAQEQEERDANIKQKTRQFAADATVVVHMNEKPRETYMGGQRSSDSYLPEFMVAAAVPGAGAEIKAERGKMPDYFLQPSAGPTATTTTTTTTNTFGIKPDVKSEREAAEYAQQYRMQLEARTEETATASSAWVEIQPATKAKASEPAAHAAVALDDEFTEVFAQEDFQEVEPAAPASVLQSDFEAVFEDEEEEWVQVGGRRVALSAVAQEDIDKMTPEERERYTELASQYTLEDF